MPYEKVGKNEPVCIADEVPFEIPESWEWVRWGTLSESIQYGYNAPAQENGRIKMVRISDIQDNSVMCVLVKLFGNTLFGNHALYRNSIGVI